MDFVKKIKERAPEYDVCHDDMITKFTVVQGGRAGTASEKETWDQGKYFSNKYEIFMYATMLGLKNDYRAPLGSNKKKFIEMHSWKPIELAEYIIMGVLAKLDVPLFEIESKDDREIEKIILDLRKLLEEYANGGFDKIKEKYDSDPAFFDNNENCFLDLLDN